MPEPLNSKFLTTQWTCIVGDDACDSRQRSEGLRLLCENYHQPVFLFVSQRCRDSEKARDLTQGFFQFLIEKEIHRGAKPEHGLFRSFILGAVKKYLANQYRLETAQKRGGNNKIFSLEAVTEESGFEPEDQINEAAEARFDHEWAVTVFEQVWTLLEEEYESLGQSKRFELLHPFIMNETGSYDVLGEQIGTSQAGAKSAAFRLRSRFRELFRMAVGQLVDNPDDVEDEISYLIQALSQGRSS